jgi:hypothetical protein
MDINYLKGSAHVVGCRFHADNKDCDGERMKAKSIHGAVIEICEKAFKEFDRNLWSRLPNIKKIKVCEHCGK